MRLVLSFSVVLAALLTTASAAELLTIKDAEARAQSANPGLVASRLEAVAAERRESQAFARHFGRVDGIASYDDFESPRLVRPMSIELFRNPAAGFSQLPWDAHQLHYGVAFELPLLAGGSLHEGYRIAALEHSAAEDTARFRREEVRVGVRTVYRHALLAHHALESAEAYRDALGKDEADARLKVKMGALAPVDAAKLTFALRGVEAQVAALAAQVRTAQAALAAFMGREPPPDDYELVEVGAEPAPPAATGSALADALAGRLDLATVRQATSVAKHTKLQARDAFGPRLSLQGSWLRNDAPSLPHALDTHEFHVTFKLPLFDGMARVNALEEAEANLAAARQREKGKELEVAAQVVEARGRIEAARAELAAGKAQRALGADVARVEHLKLEQGTGKMEDYLAARAEEMQGETSYWQGLYALQNAVDYFNFVTARGGKHD